MAGINEVEDELAGCVATQQVSRRLLELLAACELMFPVPEGTPDRFTVVQREGGPYVPVFTRLDLLRRAGGEASRYGVLSGRRLAQSLGGRIGLLLNPGDTGLLLEPNLVRMLTDGAPGPRTVPAGTRIYVGEPAHPDPALVSMLRTELVGRNRVRRAHLAQFTDGQEPPHSLVGLAIDDPDQPAGDLLEHLGRLSEVSETKPVDFLILRDGDDLSALVEQVPAVYVRDEPS